METRDGEGWGRVLRNRRVGWRARPGMVAILLSASMLLASVTTVTGVSVAPAAAASSQTYAGRVVYVVGSSELWTSDLYGNGRIRLAEGQSLYHPRWSRDGSMVAFDKSPGIWVVNADGTGERELARVQWPYAPVWSADDSRVYFAGGCIVVLDGADCSQEQSGLPYGVADVSPDGMRIASAKALPNGSYAIVVMNADGSGVRQITDGSGRGDSDPRWSPDGQRLLFTRLDTQFHTYIVGADGSGLTLVRDNAMSRAWSPDGTGVMAEDTPVTFTQIVSLTGSGGTRVGGCDPLGTQADWQPVPATPSPQVRSWGWNGFGQLGDGTTTDHPTPGTVSGLTGVVGGASGLFHSLALRDDGTVWAWGWNGFGQLGDGTTVDRATPVRVSGLSDVVCVAASAYHSLAIRRDGTVWAWGWNGAGILGDGTLADRHVPVQAVGLKDVRSISAGVLHNVASEADGSLWTWGWNGFGQLGDGTTDAHAVPTKLAGFGDSPAVSLPSIRKVAAGAYHTLALTTDGYVYSWGWNNLGQLGFPADRGSLTPVRVATSGRSIAAGAYHSVQLQTNGDVISWGWNGVGQLGDGTTAPSPPSTWAIVSLGPITAITAGWFDTFALTGDGSVFGWGWNHLGELGDGTTVDRPTPVLLPLLHGVMTVAPGPLHGLAA